MVDVTLTFNTSIGEEELEFLQSLSKDGAEKILLESLVNCILEGSAEMKSLKIEQ